MKIKFENSSFKPVTIIIETQKELDQLFAMADHCSFSHEPDDEDVSEEIYSRLGEFVKTYYVGDVTELYEVTEDEN